MPIILKNIPSVEKCFMDEDIAKKPECHALTALRGEEVHYMIAYTMTEAGEECGYTLSTSCALPYTVETVEQVPVYRPCDPKAVRRRVSADHPRSVPRSSGADGGRESGICDRRTSFRPVCDGADSGKHPCRRIYGDGAVHAGGWDRG